MNVVPFLCVCVVYVLYSVVSKFVLFCLSVSPCLFLFGSCPVLLRDTSVLSLGVFLFDSLIKAWLISDLSLDVYGLAIVCSMSLMLLCC